MKNWSFTVLLLVFVHVVCQGQYKVVRTVEWKDLDQLELDGKGAIYVTKQNGNLAKFTSTGDLLLEYSPTINDQVHQLVVNNQFKVYLFYQDFQRAVILNRYLSDPVQYSFADYGLGFVSDIAPDLQQNIWVLDISEFSLKLFDPRRNLVVETKSMSKVLKQKSNNVQRLINHQNRTYWIDQSAGVFVFDNLGNYLFKLDVLPGFDYGFYKDEIYSLQGDKIVFVNLYTGIERVRNVPEGLSGKIRVHEDRLYLIQPNGFQIYQYLSPEN
ncbi:hypothetical protein N6H18_02865 [Reichenbachiella agarivorans]|uniref:Uncharacterized protein n=1 Tax=Reichenbachiella agarivorans TaxID=2979464 RepID=A0ABY6CQW1_9BACT|nr:hypothetical protein [Reichenbachiella agarivorans]UXP32897.1 hypothetical protein N6H18_02865 [Reichenbachiella agarivorans]